MMTFSSPLRSREDRLREEEEELPGNLRLWVLDYPFGDFRKNVRPIVFRLEGDMDDGRDASTQNFGNRRK